MKQCKCEHWQQCPICMPHRFDAEGNVLPPEPTPLQAARTEIERLTAELAHMQTMQKVDQRVFEKLRETQDLAEQRWVELGECRKALEGKAE